MLEGTLEGHVVQQPTQSRVSYESYVYCSSSSYSFS